MTGRADVETVLARYPKGALTPVQAVMILASELEGAPLDPERADDAAVILRAEVLVAAGEPVRTALAHAHEELLASRPARQAAPESVVEAVSFSGPTPIVTNCPFPERVFCAVCGTQKQYVIRAGFAYPRCGHRPLAVAQPVAGTGS